MNSWRDCCILQEVKRCQRVYGESRKWSEEVRSYRLFVIIIFLIIGLSQEGFSFLKTKGKDIVDSTGQKILLRGIGLGGWLVPEGYQLHIPGFGSPTDIRNKIIDLIGETNTEEFYRRYRANYVNENDIAQIRSWGFNSIRLPFNYRLLSPVDQPGVYLEEGFQVLDQVVDWCKKYNLYLILDMHCAPGGQNSGNISDSDGIEARLWTEPANQDRTVEIWSKIAERYANEKIIGGYDLINETVLPSGHSSSELRVLFMRITSAIRKVDKNHIIFIEGNWYATDFSNLTPPWDANLVYSFHHYWGENSTNSIQHYLNIRNQYSVPLWLGETGENSNPWAYDCVQLMESQNIGWNWWTHKKIATLTSVYSSPVDEKYQNILDYWNGSAPRPSVDYAKKALFEMADHLALEYCEIRPGLLQALSDPTFGSTPKPFKIHDIPGKIDAVDYDIGNRNIAYSDIDYQNTHGPGGATWNKGWQYRNDGVDIETSSDPLGAKYDVGWIDDVEWLLYTVRVSQRGSYTIDFRISSPNNYGQIVLYLNNQKISGNISVPNTGGWKNWRTISTQNIFLPEGEHRLKMIFLKGGFNINYLNFHLVATSVEEKHLSKAAAAEFMIGQNYPNPFNGETQISVTLNTSNHLAIKIFDSRGTIIRNLFNGVAEQGFNQFIWDGTNNFFQPVASGLYFYRINLNGISKTKSMILLH